MPVTSAAVAFSVAGALHLSDPCQITSWDDDLTHWQNADVIIPGAAGDWHAHVQAHDYGEFFGSRAGRLVLLRDGAAPAGPLRDAGTVAVDSGTVVAGGPGDRFTECDWQDAYLNGDDRLLSPAKVPGSQAVICPSGIGDGGYGVFVRCDASGRPGEIIVDFLGDLSAS